MADVPVMLRFELGQALVDSLDEAVEWLASWRCQTPVPVVRPR